MAAEIEGYTGAAVGTLYASMRPRRMAAEIADRAAEPSDRVLASMRPRRMAAEILRGARQAAPAGGCFNEAAANGRGNQDRASAVKLVSKLLQ